MITFLLINQADTTWTKAQQCEGQADISLSPIGKKKFHKLGLYYQNKQIDGVITTSLARDVQAAKILQLYIPGKAIRDQRLQNINMGQLEGKFPEEIEGRYKSIWEVFQNDPLRAVFPEGESMLSVSQRVQSFLDSYKINQLFDKKYLVVTHDIIIRLIIYHIENNSAGKFWDYKLEKGSVTEINVYPNQNIINFNDMSHFNV